MANKLMNAWDFWHENEEQLRELFQIKDKVIAGDICINIPLHGAVSVTIEHLVTDEAQSKEDGRQADDAVQLAESERGPVNTDDAGDDDE